MTLRSRIWYRFLSDVTMIELADERASVSRHRKSAIMATVPNQRRTREIEYPSGDGKPMAETELHLLDMIDTILLLRDYFAASPNVYVCGNLLLYYEEGNRRKHVSPDVLVALDVPKEPLRESYLVWKEGKAPDFVVEITSKSTKHEDKKRKFGIYRDILKVSEYFLFDPTEDYLNPPLQGFRLAGGDYAPIEPIAGRLPSQVLGLHLERNGAQLRLFDPATGQRLLTPREGREAAERRAAAAEAAQQRLAAENERLRREIEALRRG
ncbi:MAG: Uma2 family endonuclease [Isosphaeraceae bacterium]